MEKYVSTLKDEKAVRSWLLCASRPDGPIFWKEPVAPNAPLDPKDKEYIVRSSSQDLNAWFLIIF
jgi:hypothetical protein